MLRRPVNWVDIKEMFTWAESALHQAAISGLAESLLELIEKGADIEAKDSHGATALHEAAYYGHETVVRLLLDHGADVNARDTEGRTALYEAAQNRHKMMMQLLLDNKADANVRELYSGWTALHMAVYHRDEMMVRLLLDHEADVTVKEVKNGWTALHLAVYHKDEKIVQLLLDHKAEINAQEHQSGWTALHLAIQNGHETVVRLLLDHKADVNKREYQSGWTALHLAIQNNHEAIAQLLLDRGADVNVQDNYGWTARCWAAQHGREVAEWPLRGAMLLPFLSPLEIVDGLAVTPAQLELLPSSSNETTASTDNRSSNSLEKSHTPSVSTSSTSSEDLETSLWCPLGIQIECVPPLVSENAGKCGGNGKEMDRLSSPGADVPQSNTISGARNCVVCAEAKQIAEFPSLVNCKHDPKVCAGCYMTWIASELDSKSWKEIKCPDISCDLLLRHPEVQQCAAPEVYARFDTLSAREALNNDPNFQWCRRADCGSGQIHERGVLENIFQCVACGYKMCLVHNDTWHEGETCKEYDYRKSRAGVGRQKRQERASARTISRFSKKCPGRSGQCGWNIEKNGGCDHMTCAKCQHEFCWICLAPYYAIRLRGNSAHKWTCRHHSWRIGYVFIWPRWIRF